MSFITLRALLFAAECLLASVLLPLLAYAASRVLRRAALRHLVWLTMFGVLAVLPLAALLLPARQIVLSVPAPAAAPAPMESIIALPPMETMERLPEGPGEKRIAALDFKVDLQPVPAMAAPAPSPVSAPATVSAEPWLTPENALLLLVLLWAAGLCWHLGRMALGGFGLMRLRRHSETFLVPGAPCELRLSPEIPGPATFGIFRPMVLLPQAARAWSADRLAAVLEHEGAHVRRHDIAGQSLARLVCAVFWFNPLLWLAARALRREAEFAADDAVLAGGMTPSAYAAELVALVSEIVEPPHRAQILGAGMADSPLLSRVQSVLAANVSRKGVTSTDIARMLSLGLVATLLLGMARVDLALAQDKPANPAPATQAAPAARPAPAAPPAPSVSPKIELEVAPRVDVEVKAIKARADAVAAEARARAEAERDPAKRAKYREEAARVAAASAEMKAKADQAGAEARQRMAQANQQMQEAQQRAREAGERALEAKARADEAQRRLEREKQSLLAPLSDEEKAGFAAARQLKITVSPVEAEATLRTITSVLGLQPTDQLRQRVILDLARQKMAALQIIDPLRTPKQAYRVSEIFRAVDRPENDARVWAEIEAIEQQIRGGASFRDLARQHSQHPTAKLGGDKGWATAEQLDAELAGVVTALKVGELSRPVRGRGGWYLLGLQEVAPGVALKAQ